MKLYLAGPMTGYEDNNIPRFNQLAVLLRWRGYTVVNPAEFDQHMTYEELLTWGLMAIRNCDGVATHGKWRQSTGARGEVNYARSRRQPVRPWWYWDFLSPVWSNHTPI